MRTYGRIYDQDGKNPRWVVVETDQNGMNDQVWITTLIQVLKLNLNESPFYGDWGIPAKPSVIQQVFPDFYVARTQQRFAQHFASLIVAKENFPVPTYKVNVTTNQGFKLAMDIAV